MSNDWRVAYAYMQKLLKQLNSHIENRDFKNAKHVSKLLQFQLTVEPLYEEERFKIKQECAKKGGIK